MNAQCGMPLCRCMRNYYGHARVDVVKYSDMQVGTSRNHGLLAFRTCTIEQ